MVVSSVRRHLDPAVPALAARGAAADRAAQGRPSLWRTPATVHQPDHRNAVLGAARANPHAVPHAVRGLGAARNFSRLEIAATRRHRHAVEPGRDPPWWSSEERRGGKEVVSTGRSRWSPSHEKKKSI